MSKPCRRTEKKKMRHCRTPESSALYPFRCSCNLGLKYDYTCGCGFLCNQTCDSSLFAIISYYSFMSSPISVWSTNPKNPVRYNATLKLTSERGLVLQDVDGTVVWSTNISTKPVAGLHLTDACNLMLLDEKMQQFGSLLITQLTPWFLGKSWCQGCNSLVEEDCFHSLSPLKCCLLISIPILPKATFIMIQVPITSVMFNFRIEA